MKDLSSLDDVIIIIILENTQLYIASSTASEKVPHKRVHHMKPMPSHQKRGTSIWAEKAKHFIQTEYILQRYYVCIRNG